MCDSSYISGCEIDGIPAAPNMLQDYVVKTRDYYRFMLVNCYREQVFHQSDQSINQLTQLAHTALITGCTIERAGVLVVESGQPRIGNRRASQSYNLLCDDHSLVFVDVVVDCELVCREYTHQVGLATDFLSVGQSNACCGQQKHRIHLHCMC
jgi:hypothetical protein